MSENSKNSAGLILAVAVVALLAVGAYFFIGKKDAEQSAPPVSTATTETTTTEADTDTPPQPESVQDDKKATEDTVVTETKTLDIPSDKSAEPAPAVDAAAATLPADVASMMGQRTLGADTAPIKVVEYSSLTCGHCAAFHTQDLAKVKTDYIDTGKVQFIFKEYPLNEQAVIASQVLRCMPADTFVNFMGLLFEQQQNWAFVPDYKDKLTQYAKLAGLSEEKINACIDNVDLKKAIVTEMQTANEKYRIASTPTFIVNGGEKIIVGHQPYDFFKSTFDGLLSAQPATPADPAAPATSTDAAAPTEAPKTE